MPSTAKNFPQRRALGWLLRGAVIAWAAVLAACGASTTIEQSWKAPNTPPGDLTNVVTLYVSRDTTVRRNAEDSMAQKLSRSGVRAVPAYSILTDEDLQDVARAKEKLVANGFDGVIAMRVVQATQQLEYTPTTFYGYWGAAWPAAYGPGYLSTETVVRVETNAYSLKSDQLVWSALSKTIDPNSVGSAIGDVTTVVAKALQQQQIVASAGTTTGAG